MKFFDAFRRPYVPAVQICRLYGKDPQNTQA